MAQNEKTIIVRFRYDRLRNNVHMEYHDEANLLIIKYGGAAALGFAALYAIYKPLYDAEVAALDQVPGSAYTEEIVKQDAERDRLFSGFAGAIKSYLNHYDYDRREMARKLEKIMKHYGNVAGKPRDEQTGLVKDIVRELEKPENYTLVVGLELAPWLTELARANAKFEELMMARNAEILQHLDLHMRPIRAAVDKAFREILDLLEALVRVQGPTTDEAFIKELNNLSTHYKDVLAQETGRRHPVKDLSAGDHCVVEPIETLQYTGKAITPVPVAYYRGDEGKPTVELVFARDFSLTYKNNVEVGTADVTLHGKGAYKGQKTVTFNIAR
jgi:hypothetical protein